MISSFTTSNFYPSTKVGETLLSSTKVENPLSPFTLCGGAEVGYIVTNRVEGD
jgi:hypothetical protein